MLVSIVIPTHNRPELLRRAAMFYGRLDLQDVAIYVLDSSERGVAQSNARMLAASAPAIIHLNVPDTPFYAKIAQALPSLPSDFVVLSGDDDIHNPAACLEAARFLQNNPDFALAHGIAFAAVTTSGKCDLHPYHQSEILSKTASSRVIWHLSHYCTTFYSVHRKDQAIKSMLLARDHTVEKEFGELLPTCAAVAAGKSKMLDIPFLLRQSGHRQATSSGARFAMGDYVRMKRFPRDYAAFAEALAGEIAVADNIKIERAVRVVDRAFSGYLQAVLSDVARSEAPARIRRYDPAHSILWKTGEGLERVVGQIRRRSPVNWSTRMRPGAGELESSLGGALAYAFDLIRKHPFGIAS